MDSVVDSTKVLPIPEFNNFDYEKVLANIKVEPLEPETDGSKSENNEVIDPYEKKYFALLRRCENIQQSNERLVNRIYHVKKLLRRLHKERSFLLQRLDQYGDDYMNVPLTLFIEEDSTTVFPPENLPLSKLSPSTSNPPPTKTKQPVVTNTGLASKKKIKQEKEKDPNAPKRPANPFFLFCQEQRSTVMERFNQEQKEEISHQELTKALAKNWNNLSTEDKKIYYNMYEKEKERYEQEMKLYTSKESLGADKG